MDNPALPRALEPNRYSGQWFELFLPPEAVAPTDEIAFLVRQLGPAGAGLVLDAGAGTGRHAIALARAITGRVLALDRDRAASERCRWRAQHSLPAARRDALLVLAADLHRLPLRAASVDVILSLWQSFGYGDSETNARLLVDFARILRPGGRLVLDVYHRGAQRRLPSEREIERDGVRVRERRRWTGSRLDVELEYAPEHGAALGRASSRERFSWQVYEPEELTALAARAGFRLELACANFSEAIPAGAAHPRMQLVYVRENPLPAGTA
jgi:SAM-dependent methyltransferase